MLMKAAGKDCTALFSILLLLFFCIVAENILLLVVDSHCNTILLMQAGVLVLPKGVS